MPAAADWVMHYPGLLNRHPRAPAGHMQGVLACIYEAQQAVIARAAAAAAASVCLDNRAGARQAAQRMLHLGAGGDGEIVELDWRHAEAVAAARRPDATVVLYALPGRTGGCALAAPAALSSYLPLPMVAWDGEAYRLLTPAERPQSVGRFSQHLGPVADLVRFAALAALSS